MNTGAIIIGYQGVGKSTLANSDCRFVDLESGNFRNGSDRYDDWYLIYCRIAESIANQGYIVLVSSHKEVRRYFSTLPNIEIPVYACIPSITLKSEWIDKLEKRFDESGTSKDFRAWKNAKLGFDKSISKIKDEFPNVIELSTMQYNLLEEIGKVISI